MKRLIQYTLGLMIGSTGLASAWAGEAATNAWANNGWGGSGTAGATAGYDGNGGIGVARTRTDTGQVSRSRGWAVGVDEDGLDFSYSHAIAPQHGPAYAGTFNLSIGRDGDVNGSYGGVVARGGATRSVEAGGVTRSGRHGGSAQAHASGHTAPGGRVDVRTHSYSRQQPSRVVRSRYPTRHDRSLSHRSAGRRHLRIRR